MASEAGIIFCIAGGVLLFKQQKEKKRLQNIWNLLTVDGTIIHKQLLKENVGNGQSIKEK